MAEHLHQEKPEALELLPADCKSAFICSSTCPAEHVEELVLNSLTAIFFCDAFAGKKKLKDALSSVLSDVK